MNHPLLRDLPDSDRPRERLLRHGAHALEPEELLALVLSTGRGTGEDVLQLARRVLAELDGVEGLATTSLERLLSVRGIGPVKATRIRAAFELALRAGPVEPPTPPIDPRARHIERLRGQVPTGQAALLGYQPQGEGAPITLALGSGLGASTRAGALLAQLLVTARPGRWWVVAVRPGGPPRKKEADAARRLFQAAEALDLPLEQVLVVGGQSAWSLDAQGETH